MQPRTDVRGAAAGLTIVEVLVSVALLSVIVLVVLTPLTGFFGLTRRSGTQVSATQNVQRAIEIIRGEWLSAARYDQACWTAPLPDTTPALQVQVTNLDPAGAASGTPDWRPSCLAGAAITPDTAPARRLQVTQVDAQGRVLSSLSVEIARP